jgi:hypothetical protein
VCTGRVALLFLLDSESVWRTSPPILELPARSMKLPLALLGIGLVVAIVLDWICDPMTKGVKRDAGSWSNPGARSG